jgi:hypothetical protein
MNFLGKLLVLLFGTGSIFCLITAMAIYTQKMDFVTPQGQTPAKTKSRVDESIGRTKELLKANNRAYTRWLGEYEEVVKLEADLVQRREFYRGQLELIATGKYESIARDDAIQDLPEHDPADGMLKIDKPTGRPPIKVKVTMAPENAKPRPYYVDRIKKSYEDFETVQDLDKKTCEKITKATDAINGTALVKGLRTRIDEQSLIAVNADAETVYLEDFITNRRADAQLFVKRRNALNASIARLQRALNKPQGGN